LKVKPITGIARMHSAADILEPVELAELCESREDLHVKLAPAIAVIPCRKVLKP
jgi:hypothetical protein